MRRTAIAAAFAVVGLALAACSSGTPTAQNTETGGAGAAAGAGDASQVEVFTWWSSGSEELGLNAMVKVFETQHPETKFVNGAVAGGGGSAKNLLQDKLNAGNPPDSFQAHAGKEIADYIAAGQVEDVSALYDEFDLKSVFPQDLVDLLTSDGKIYSIPSNIHRANVLWSSDAVLKEAGIDPAKQYKSWDEFITDLDKIKAKGKTALSVGAAWTQVHLLETVLIGTLGAEKYKGLWDGTTDWNSPEVTTALTTFEKLMSYTNKDRDSLDWSEPSQMLIDGKAGFNIMGDWAPALFDEQKQVAGTDYHYQASPGSEGVYDFLADSFTLTVGAPHPGGAKNWLNTISSKDGQIAFNKVKGSIPARNDIDAAEFSEYQQSAMKSFQSDTIVPSLQHGAASTIAQLNNITAAVSKFTSGASDVKAFQTELAAAMAAS